MNVFWQIRPVKTWCINQHRYFVDSNRMKFVSSMIKSFERISRRLESCVRSLIFTKETSLRNPTICANPTLHDTLLDIFRFVRVSTKDTLVKISILNLERRIFSTLCYCVQHLLNATRIVLEEVESLYGNIYGERLIIDSRILVCQSFFCWTCVSHKDDFYCQERKMITKVRTPIWNVDFRVLYNFLMHRLPCLSQICKIFDNYSQWIPDLGYGRYIFQYPFTCRGTWTENGRWFTNTMYLDFIYIKYPKWDKIKSKRWYSKGFQNYSLTSRLGSSSICLRHPPYKIYKSYIS